MPGHAGLGRFAPVGRRRSFRLRSRCRAAPEGSSASAPPRLTDAAAGRSETVEMAAAAEPDRPSVDPKDVAWLRRRVRAWFEVHGRSFPWRRTRDAYEVLVAELLLQ